MRLPSATFVPSKRTTKGTPICISLAAATTPSAITSQRIMPPKIFIKTARIPGLASINLNAAATFSLFAPPPTSKKFAGSPPHNFNNIHSRHRQPGTIDHTTDIADEEDAAEAEAAKYDLSYISLNGDIGCMVNGAGLAMATMDIIKLCGGEPANFLDVGGGANKEKVAAAFKLMLANPGIRAVLINIFGGIMRCDVIADGVVAAAREMQIGVPLVVRLEGTNVAEGKRILADSGLAIIAATTMQDAAEKAVQAAQ